MADSDEKRFRFTKKSIDALRPYSGAGGAREAEYTDTEVSGLKLCITRTGKKWFLLRYTLSGAKLSMKLGDYGVIDVEEARKRALAAKRKVLDGIDPKPAKKKEDGRPTFRQFSQNDYLAYARDHKRSFDDDESKLKTHLYGRFGNCKMADITSRDIQAYLSYLLVDKKLAPATANRHLSLLSGIFRLAVQYEQVEKNPCSGIRKFKENNAIDRSLSQDELRRFQEAMDEEGDGAEENRVAVAVIRLLLLTGVRREEALHARWQDMDLKTGKWFLPDTKNGDSRFVTLNAEAIKVVEVIEPVEGCEYVFVNPDTGQRLNNPVKAFKRLLKKAGIEKFRIHDLRHTYASIAVNGGVALYSVSKLLGHRSMQTTQRYAHLADSTLREAADCVGDYVKSAKN